MNFIKKHKGFSYFVGGIIFNFVESLYFGIGTEIGFNHSAQSISEFICDDISLVIMGYGTYLMGLKLFNKDI